MDLLYYSYIDGKGHHPILNYQNFEKLSYLLQGICLDCSRTMVRVCCFPLSGLLSDHGEGLLLSIIFCFLVGALCCFASYIIIFSHHPGDLFLSTADVNPPQVESLIALSETCSLPVFEGFSSIPRVKSSAWGHILISLVCLSMKC